MAEDKTPNSEAADASTEDSGAPEGKANVDKLQADLAEAIKRRDSFAKKYRETNERLQALEQAAAGKDKDDAEKSGDIAKLRTEYQKDLEAKDTRLQELGTQLNKVIVESKFKSIAAQYFIDSAIDDVWALTREQFDLEKDDEGNLVPVVKGKPIAFDAYIKQLADAKPYLAKNPKKSGSGANGAGNSATGGDITVEQLHRMSSAEQRAAMQKDPALAKKVLEGFKPS